MALLPKLPPGRPDRKALAFSAEIHRLRAAGYSFEAIRQALLDAGVTVGRTTVKREAARPSTAIPGPEPLVSASSADPLPRAGGPASASSSSDAAPLPPQPDSRCTRPSIEGKRYGLDIADQFFEGHFTNCLLQGKDLP